MENSNLIILKISNIKWNENPSNNEKLPTELDLQWAKKEWTYSEVSDWLSSYYKNSVNDLMIEQSENTDSGG